MIFYVDDDSDNLEIFSDAMKDAREKHFLNYNVKLYSFGDKLLDDLREIKPAHALVFLDINMPIKNGFDILVEIRNDTELKHLPVIMYSTTDDPNSINTAIDLGANLYVVKPLLHREVTEILKKISLIDWGTFLPEKKIFSVP